jgi:hypothetical protein
MSRRIELDINKDDANASGFHTSFDNYGAILYCAYTVNQSMAFQLYKAMVSEYHYKLGYNIPLGNLTDTDEEVYLPLSELSGVISFINNQVLPALQVLPLDLDLTVTWNVGNSLEAFLMNQGSFFDNFNIDDIDQDGYTVSYFIAVFNQLRDFFQDALNQNAIYKVRIA